MRLKMGVAVAVAGAVAAGIPALGAAGAFHGSESWTDQPTSLFGPDECADRFVTGQGSESGTVTFVDTPNGGFHVRVDIRGRVDLYEATNLDPNDPRPGAFVGTWTFEGHGTEQFPPNGKGTISGVTEGPLVLADGTIARRQVSFHLTLDEDGPAKVFFAKFVCAGA